MDRNRRLEEQIIAKLQSEGMTKSNFGIESSIDILKNCVAASRLISYFKEYNLFIYWNL